MVEQHLGDDVEAFLGDHDLEIADVDALGRAIPAARRSWRRSHATLDLPDGRARRSTWRSLAAVGNLSSASVLHVLARHAGRAAGRAPGAPGLLMAMGPGFCSELVLLRW